jgi:hypothetical protein
LVLTFLILEYQFPSSPRLQPSTKCTY